MPNGVVVLFFLLMKTEHKRSCRDDPTHITDEAMCVTYSYQLLRGLS